MYGGAENGGGGVVLERRPAAHQASHLAPRRRLSIRGGSGLGDAIYLQSIARALIEQGHHVEACTDWPDVFAPLGDDVTVSPFRRDRIDRLAHYSMRRGKEGTDQFADGCIQAGLAGPVEFRLGWNVKDDSWRERLRAAGKPAVLVQMPRPPFGRSDSFGMEFLPDFRTVQRAIDLLRGKAFLVQVGQGETLYPLDGIDLDLSNATSVCDLLDIATIADGFLGYCSFIVPLAEAQRKPALLIWSRKGMKSPHDVVRRMTPQKVLHRKDSSRFVFDDCQPHQMGAAVETFCRQIGCPGEV